jgi:Mn2+/Fe2+ NRAMP family transporter
LGDLTQVKEFPLMCPINRIGTVDLWIVSHHGQPMSNSQALVHAIHPRVAILNNGTRKGGQPAAMKVIYSSPGLEDLWQLHFSLLSGQEYTQPGLFIANTINVAADLGAMADALRILVGGPGIVYVVVFGAVSVLAQVFFDYKRYVAILKWLTLVLFAYVIALAVVKVPWSEALKGLVIPRISWNGAFLTTLVAILGTTISPYLFIWQSSEEAENQRTDSQKKPLREDGSDRHEEFRRIRVDTLVGMAMSNLIAIAIMITTGATLHAKGVTDIQSSSQAAEALKPVAGQFAELVFALGIIGTGLLAVPVLAGSAAYAIGEGRKWPVGLSRKPKQAVAFYSVLALSVLLGIGLNFTPIDPIKALYWSAVINGVLAAPVMVLVMILVRRKNVMGELVVRGWLYWLGWASTVAMAFCIVGLAAASIGN